MPGKTTKQRKFAGCSADPECRKKLKKKGIKPMPVKVAKKFRRKK